MRIDNTIDQVRKEKVPAGANGLVPFIVLIQYAPDRAIYGVNFLAPNTVTGTGYPLDHATGTVVERF